MADNNSTVEVAVEETRAQSHLHEEAIAEEAIAEEAIAKVETTAEEEDGLADISLGNAGGFSPQFGQFAKLAAVTSGVTGILTLVPAAYLLLSPNSDSEKNTQLAILLMAISVAHFLNVLLFVVPMIIKGPADDIKRFSKNSGIGNTFGVSLVATLDFLVATLAGALAATLFIADLSNVKQDIILAAGGVAAVMGAAAGIGLFKSSTVQGSKNTPKNTYTAEDIEGITEGSEETTLLLGNSK